LTALEVAIVLDATRQALAGKTLRLSSTGTAGGPEVLMGPDGQPKVRRFHGTVIAGFVGGITADGSPSAPSRTWREDITTITDYTGRPARDCNGSGVHGELVIEYELRSSTHAWTVHARRRDARDRVGIGSAVEMLRGGAAVTSRQRSQLDEPRRREFVAAWTPPNFSADVPRIGDPTPNVVGVAPPNEFIQSLWIDTESLLPRRWEASKGGDVTDGFDVIYEVIDLRPPAGVAAPECIPWQ
jgi:hypothetical protein